MVARPFTATNITPNKSVRQNVPRRGVVLHHAAMTNFEGLKRLEMGAKQVSSTAIVKDTRNEQMIPEGFRAWSLSSAYWDSALRSVETCNQSTDGWTVSDESHWELAKNVAYWSELDGWWPHRSGARETWTVIGHREVYTIHDASYATACPGGMNLDLVTSRAQGLRGGHAAPASSTPATSHVPAPVKTSFTVGPVLRSGSDWAYRRPAGELAKRVARALIAKERLPKNYLNDGDPGPLFDKAVQTTLRFSNIFRGTIDGKIERGGTYGVQDYATIYGDYGRSGGKRDGRPEGLSWACFALGLERP